MRRRHDFIARGIAIAVLFLAASFSFPVCAQTPTDELAYHGGDLGSNGVNANEQVLTPGLLTVNTFGKLFTTSVTDTPTPGNLPAASLGAGMNYTAPSGQVYAEPLVKTGVNITTGNYQGTHDVVFVATAMDSLYAIDADGGIILWKDSFLYNASGNSNPLNPAIPTGVTAVPAGYGSEINTAHIQNLARNAVRAYEAFFFIN